MLLSFKGACRATAILLTLVMACPVAAAYQVPSSAFSQGSAAMPGSALTQTISTTGKTELSVATTAGSRGATPQTYDPQLAGSTPSQEIKVNTGDCANTGPCSNRGTLTISFSQPVFNPILHIAGIGGTASETSGGQVRKQSELHSIFTLATSGITLSKASTGNNFALNNGTTITATDDDTSPACNSTSTGAGPPAKATAACGSVLVNGTVTSLTFNVTAIFTKSASLPAFNTSTSADAVSIVASVREDFGDAPASYDAGDAARAVLGNVKLGAGVSEDNPDTANGKTSPNTSGDSDDDGVTLVPLATTATSYSTTVVISGATKSGQVCGWIDFDKNGTFDSGERACAPVTAGQTSATLNWTGLSGLTAGSTYARFRVGYTTGQVQSPTGASDSGEVEDYPFTIALPDPPAATPDTDSTPQDVNVTVNPLTNDKAGTGAVLVPGSVVLKDPADGTYKKSVTIPGEGTYTVNADGTVTFDPLPAFTGQATPVGYRVADNTGQTATSTITITVTPVKPEAVDDTNTTPYDTPVTTSVLTNDKPGHPSAPLVPGSVCIVSGDTCAKTHTVAGEGSYTVNPDGTIAFDPVPGFAGKTTPITYRVADDNGATDTATLTITVQPPPPPTAKPDTGTTPQNVNVTVNPLTNDTAGAGALDPTSVCIVSGGGCVKTHTVPGEGTYTVKPDGTVDFDPVPTFTGQATPITYRVSDSFGQPATSTITITVTPITPQAVNDSRTTPFETPVTIPVLENDKAGDPSAPLVPGSVKLVDPQTGNLVTTVTVPNEGTYAVSPDDGTVKFTPANGFAGTTTPLTYQVSDTNGTPAKATITVTVNKPPAPQAKPDTGTTPQDVNVTVNPLTNDTAGTGTTLDPASVCIVSGNTCVKTYTVPNEGSYTVQPDGTVEFDPLPGFTGQATPVTYRVSDAFGQPATSTITITVTPIKPIATDDAATTPFNTPVTVPVLGNDKAGDPSAPLDPASVCIVSGSTCVKTYTVPNEGTYSVNPDGSIAFDPVDGFQGVTTPITYRVKDDNGTPADALLTVTVGDAPDANPDTKTTNQNVNVTVDPLTNDKPGAGGTLDPKSVEVFDPGTKSWGRTATVPGEGTYTVDPQTGKITFDPETAFTGQSEVPYRVTDSHGNTAASTVTITVTPIKPTAIDDTATTPYNTPVTVPVAKNDKPGSPGTPLVPSSVRLIDPATGNRVTNLTVPGEGTYTVNPDGTVKFTPENGYKGTTTPVTYEIKDANGTPAKAELTITVGDRPAAAPDRATTKQGVEVTLPVLANDRPGTGAELDPATVRLIDPKTGEPVLRLTVPGEGLWIVHPDGTLTFRPEPDFTGTTTPVRYEVKDSNGNPARSTATVTVTEAGARALPDAGKGRPSEPVVLDPLANDTPSKGANWKPGSVCLVTSSGACVKRVVVPDVGAWTVGNDGRIWFVSDPDFRGTAKIPYRVTDTNGVTVQSTAEVTIKGVDDLPETGGPLALLLIAGALLVATGGALAALARRRRRP